MSELDWSGVDFAAIMRRLHAPTPIADRYESDFLQGEHWWVSQRQHLVGWFSEISGAGAYGRKVRGATAKTAYNRFQCAPGLLWLAEALGESPEVVMEAARLAGGQGRPASQCAAIRKVIPWGRIAELADKQSRGRLHGGRPHKAYRRNRVVR